MSVHEHEIPSEVEDTSASASVPSGPAEAWVEAQGAVDFTLDTRARRVPSGMPGARRIGSRTRHAPRRFAGQLKRPGKNAAARDYHKTVLGGVDSLATVAFGRGTARSPDEGSPTAGTC